MYNFSVDVILNVKYIVIVCRSMKRIHTDGFLKGYKNVSYSNQFLSLLTMCMYNILVSSSAAISKSNASFPHSSSYVTIKYMCMSLTRGGRYL